MAFVIVLVSLAAFFIPGLLVRPVAKRWILGKAAHADPNGFLLRLDLKRSLVGFKDFAHCTMVKRKKKRLSSRNWWGQDGMALVKVLGRILCLEKTG
jgi:hypothetical protein